MTSEEAHKREKSQPAKDDSSSTVMATEGMGVLDDPSLMGDG
jgi:hypothetical protein